MWNQHSDSFKNTFLGTLAHQFKGTLTYTDEVNGLQGVLTIG